MDRDAAVKLVCDAMALDVALKDAAARKANAPFERIRELEAEVERLRKDAERLDWLDSVKERAGQEWWIWSAQYESLTMASKSYVCESGEVQRRSIREAIDAALAAGKE